MSSRKHRFPVRAAVWGAALTALLLAGVEATADDRDLLRFDSGKPYVFILLDTSGSMTLAPDGSWLPGSGDDPGSRIFQAKKALYEVFRSVGDVNIGFATFNQDRLRVRAKHWLYEVEPPSTGGRLSLAGGEYPSTGELMTLGAHFAIGTPGVAGNCANPLPFATQRDRINRFAKLGVDGLRQTTIWLSDAGKTYRLTVGPDAGEALGSSTLSALFTLDAVPDCASPPPPPAPGAAVTGAQARVRMSLVQEFLMRDLETTAGSVEPSGGFWPWEDAFGAASCTDGTPFSGRGWEGNYDSSLDRWCDPANPLTCRNLKHTTVTSPIAPELDLGDVIPLNWDVTNIDEMLDRLAPDRALGTETFAAAPFFTDQPVGPGLALKQSGQRPIVAAGSDSPLGKAIADFRCWYLGQGAPKCRSFGAPTGWENVAAEEDTEWGCRQPYLIVVGDGGDSCQGENPCADTANLFAQAGVRSWVITYGGANRPPLSCIAQNGRGELIFVSDGDNLQDELRRILGEIRQETATFASAAAPSTQRVVDRTIYVSTFTPISGSSRWDGHLDSFLKPLPLTTAGQPNRDSDQHQWDAGEELVAQAPTLATAVGGDLDLGRGEDERRIFYARERTSTGRVQPGGWPLARRAFDWTEDSTPAYIRYDLWEGLRIPFTADDPAPPPGLSGVDQTAQNSANLVLSKTVATRSATVEGEPVTFVLGDIFHSDPVVLGSPANTRLFAEDAESDGRTCEEGNRGYRCFFRKHQFRRKQLLVGSNDGMLHAFDAGLPEVVTDPLGNEDIRFNEGTGREIFAYVPRAVLPNVRRLTESSTHRFTVDGPPVAADVFIDPLGAANPDEREFRTVVITGLREGGASYFALDVTQPDEIG
ncbi:MAG: PilC/PilY family type IV pilus protein, partial [Thermoanaerobaculia bacterium]|nr:PilC/PilY family type IV pilus protein [Thermoanaerobaculia bacterium]